MQATDIIMTIPSYCDDCETWHQDQIWAHGDGTYSSADECGDHEPLDEADLPSQEEHDRLWREYSQWVVDRGEDPLGNFYVRHSIHVRERWQFRVVPTLVGPRLIDARHAGHRFTWTHLDELPENVRSFLNLDSSGKLGDFESWNELLDVLPEVKANRWFTAHLEYDKPRSPSVIARELRKAARRSQEGQMTGQTDAQYLLTTVLAELDNLHRENGELNAEISGQFFGSEEYHRLSIRRSENFGECCALQRMRGRLEALVEQTQPKTYPRLEELS